jgi:hypothetical protein
MSIHYPIDAILIIEYPKIDKITKMPRVSHRRNIAKLRFSSDINLTLNTE